MVIWECTVKRLMRDDAFQTETLNAIEQIICSAQADGFLRYDPSSSPLDSIRLDNKHDSDMKVFL